MDIKILRSVSVPTDDTEKNTPKLIIKNLIKSIVGIQKEEEKLKELLSKDVFGRNNKNIKRLDYLQIYKLPSLGKFIRG